MSSPPLFVVRGDGGEVPAKVDPVEAPPVEALRLTREQEAEQVFEAWRRRQIRPDVCRLTKDRVELIVKVFRLGYTVEDLLLLVRYAWEADEPGPRWWRGENPDRKKYLDVANLLRKEKLAARIEAARVWVENVEAAPEGGADGDAVDYGPMAAYRRALAKGGPIKASEEEPPARAATRGVSLRPVK